MAAFLGWSGASVISRSKGLQKAIGHSMAQEAFASRIAYKQGMGVEQTTKRAKLGGFRLEAVDTEGLTKRLIKLMERVDNNKQVVAGIAEGVMYNAGRYPSDRKRTMTMASIAAINEFGGTAAHPGGTQYFWKSGEMQYVSNDYAGTKQFPRTKPHEITIPERPFLRASMQRNKRKYMKMIADNLQGMIKGEIKPAQVYRKIGWEVVKDVKNTISTWDDPSNAKSTVKHKGGNNPLSDTGQLSNAIKYRVIPLAKGTPLYARGEEVE